jgi:hypothetical protein
VRHPAQGERRGEAGGQPGKAGDEPPWTPITPWAAWRHRWLRPGRGRDGEWTQRFAPALGLQECQGAAPPAVGLRLQPQEQLAALGVGEFPVRQAV